MPCSGRDPRAPAWYSHRLMRVGLALAVALGATGCATTVGRAPGSVTVPGGAARGTCESEAMLALAPTRYLDDSGATVRRDGTGVYRVGETHPESLPALDPVFGGTPLTQRRAEAVAPHDRDRVVAGVLGVGALTALTVGSLLFVSAFETEAVTRSDGTTDEEQRISSSRAVGGGIVVGVGFGLAVAGLIVNPGAKERAIADRQRYVLTREDEVATVTSLIERNNAAVRSRCAKPAP